jgi:hypothetical protein
MISGMKFITAYCSVAPIYIFFQRSKISCNDKKRPVTALNVTGRGGETRCRTLEGILHLSNVDIISAESFFA